MPACSSFNGTCCSLMSFSLINCLSYWCRMSMNFKRFVALGAFTMPNAGMLSFYSVIDASFMLNVFSSVWAYIDSSVIARYSLRPLIARLNFPYWRFNQLAYRKTSETRLWATFCPFCRWTSLRRNWRWWFWSWSLLVCPCLCPSFGSEVQNYQYGWYIAMWPFLFANVW